MHNLHRWCLTIACFGKDLGLNRGNGCICIVHCSSQLQLGLFLLAKIYNKRFWLSAKTSMTGGFSSCWSLLSRHEFVQVDLGVVDAIIQVGANVGAQVLFIHTQA